MLGRLSIVSGLTTMSILGLGTVSISTPAYAQCSRNFEDCAHVTILHCGDQSFVGGSDMGNALDIARIKARSAGYNPDFCKVRHLQN